MESKINKITIKVMVVEEEDITCGGCSASNQLLGKGKEKRV